LLDTLRTEPFVVDDVLAVAAFAADHWEVVPVLSSLPTDLATLREQLGQPQLRSVRLQILSDPEGGLPVLWVEVSSADSVEAGLAVLRTLRRKHQVRLVTFDVGMVDDV
jgi:hypothetical protein